MRAHNMELIHRKKYSVKYMLPKNSLNLSCNKYFLKDPKKTATNTTK